MTDLDIQATSFTPVVSSIFCNSSFDAPKSDSFITPMLSTSTFAHFKSLWIMPLSWRYYSPSSIYLVYSLTNLSSKDLNLSNSCLIDPPGTNSRIMSTPSPSSLISDPKYLTILGWDRFLSICISYLICLAYLLMPLVSIENYRVLFYIYVIPLCF